LFTEFHGLSENPFTILPSPRLAWLGASMRKVRAELCEAVLEGQGLVVLSGGPGVGKSLALTLLANDLEQSGVPCRIHVLNCGVQASATELLSRIPEDAAGDDDAATTDRLTVLLLDDAQRLCSAELGALLHAISRRADCVCLVLAGAPKLELAVNEALAEHPATVATHWSLEALQPVEISSYIAGRLQAAGGGGREIFTAGAIECLARHSGGVPRRLNVLCSGALFLAWREGRHDVDASIVEAATQTAVSLQGEVVPTWAQIRRRPALHVLVTAVAAIVFLLVAINWCPRDEQPASHANAPMTAEVIVPAEPSIIAPINQPPAPSQNPTPVAKEAEPPEASPALAMQRADAFVPQNDSQGASAAEGQTPDTMRPVELAELLARARQQIKAFALTTPAGDNALETLQRVLAAMPAQPDALQGIQDIANRYAVLAAQADWRGEHDLAGRYVDKGLDVVPDHPDLLALRQKLAAQPASQPGTNLPPEQSVWIMPLVEKPRRGHQQPN
jgi:type II secretory pathway predicted ATPase ExeA